MNLKLFCMAKTNYGWKCYERTGGSVIKGKLLYPFFPFHHIHSSIHLSSCGLFILPFFSSVLWQLCLSSDHCCISSDRLLRSPSHLLPLLSSPPMLSLNLKWDVMLHLHPSLVPCERLDLSEAMEGWEKDLSTARERRDDLSVYICLVPQPRWGIDVVLRSRSEAEIEKALEEDEQERKVKRFSERIRRSLGSLAFSITFLEPLNDVFEPKCSDPRIPNVDVNSA